MDDDGQREENDEQGCDGTGARTLLTIGLCPRLFVRANGNRIKMRKMREKKGVRLTLHSSCLTDLLLRCAHTLLILGECEIVESGRERKKGDEGSDSVRSLPPRCCSDHGPGGPRGVRSLFDSKMSKRESCRRDALVGSSRCYEFNPAENPACRLLSRRRCAGLYT